MPELPEVETIRRGLIPQVCGRKVNGVRILWTGVVQNVSPGQLRSRLLGQKVSAVERRGKFLVLRFESGDGLGVHLRMTGRLQVVPEAGPDDSSLRAAIAFDDGRQLRFSDVRKFGRLYWIPAGDDSLFRKLGPEPLDGLTLEDFRRIVDRKRQVKSILLDQTRLAGVGNIYADESLHRAGIHPAERGCDLTFEAVSRLYDSLRGVLNESIGLRGTTYRDYVDSLGRRGEFQEQLAVYGRKGKACPDCGTEIRRDVVANRGTHYCPKCQPRRGGG